MISYGDLKTLILLAGLAHIGLGLGSLAVPKLLNWNTELSKVLPLIRQMFWTYAAYIFSINIFFGIISVIFSDELLSGNNLSLSLLLLIFLYWLARIGIQFFYFDKTGTPKGFWYSVGEVVLVLLFAFFCLVYGWAIFQTWR